MALKTILIGAGIGAVVVGGYILWSRSSKASAFATGNAELITRSTGVVTEMESGNTMRFAAMTPAQVRNRRQELGLNVATVSLDPVTARSGFDPSPGL